MRKSWNGTPGVQICDRRLNRMLTGTVLGLRSLSPTRILSVSTMTAQRRDLIGRHCTAGMVLLAALLFAWACSAATTERVVADRYTGLAIGGFDPVAYFTDAQPVRGDADYELSAAG